MTGDAPLAAQTTQTDAGNAQGTAGIAAPATMQGEGAQGEAESGGGVVAPTVTSSDVTEAPINNSSGVQTGHSFTADGQNDTVARGLDIDRPDRTP